MITSRNVIFNEISGKESIETQNNSLIPVNLETVTEVLNDKQQSTETQTIELEKETLKKYPLRNRLNKLNLSSANEISSANSHAFITMDNEPITFEEAISGEHSNKMEIMQLDVKTAFLNGDLNE